MTIIEVAVAGPFLTPLSYLLDSTATAALPVVGGRVRVPFRSKSLVGVVMAVQTFVDEQALQAGCAALSLNLKKLKSIEAVLDTAPLFSAKDMELLKWASFYYHEPIGNVMQTALPKRLRQGEVPEVEGVTSWVLAPQSIRETLPPLPANAKQQLALIDCLSESQALSAEHLNAQLNHWRTPMKRLLDLGWVQETTSPCLNWHSKLTRPGHILNAEQQVAVDAVDFDKGYQAFLLEGITGSGKTEVYLGMIERCLHLGKQVLVLVPEIGLTPQTVQRFEAYLQQPVAVMHSGLNDKERQCAWWLVQSGRVQVLLGTRSAVFTPFANLGLCIMDEEHDLSFKQQDGFRYSARDCLVRRAHLEKVPVVLGSATPSLESLYNAQTQRYAWLKLQQRAAGAQLPNVQLLDIRGEKLAEGVSTPLRKLMAQHLADQGQVLLFLNRRGFAPVLMCHDCGWQAACPSCDANMTYHQQVNELRCHHCGYQHKAPHTCPHCQSAEFVKVGQGTERLEETIQSWFPEESLLRIDADTTRLKGQMAELTQQAKEGKARILIGTQMLAKGHHFPQVTLVGLLDIDQGLFSSDFRAAERMAQLIVQVSGRAGRAEKTGTVMIQTHHPEHPLLKTLVAEGYEAFAKQALLGREEAGLPPYEYQILIRAEAIDAQAGWQFLNEIKFSLQSLKPTLLAQASSQVNAQVMGPVAAPMMRRQGRYRYQLLLQSNHRGTLHQWLGQVESRIYASKLTAKVRWSIDVDPQEMN
ncbi:primosomal protein N' [Thiosulfativibrio zosterae]|uniref:Replication restart protein PriA n=1 Tax=Thiosulfativibrio zosterae TaxID=2675053 RepID=A0A6F8PK65_9GAMM|nr:primosomal protein N' [Thiosulfativibrio zosterae]BBP42447.1 primosomal protein N' [Thiosulfativibrio zosterae]